MLGSLPAQCSCHRAGEAGSGRAYCIIPGTSEMRATQGQAPELVTWGGAGRCDRERRGTSFLFFRIERGLPVVPTALARSMRSLRKGGTETQVPPTTQGRSQGPHLFLWNASRGRGPPPSPSLSLAKLSHL